MGFVELGFADIVVVAIELVVVDVSYHPSHF
jgi:hypothetical protein